MSQLGGRTERRHPCHLETLPLRDHFRRRLTALWDYPRTSLPAIENGRLFYAKNSGLQRQAPIYVRAGVFDPPDARARSQSALTRWIDIGVAIRAVARCQMAGVCRRERRRRLGNGASAQRRHSRGSRRRSRVGAFLRAVVDARLPGLLLLPLSRTAEAQGARGRALGPGRLLPSPRHAAVRRPTDLSADRIIRRGSSTPRSATTAVTFFSRRIAAPTTTTSCTSSTWHTPARRGFRRRFSRLSKRLMRSSRRLVTTSRGSTCAATRTRRIAA